MNCLLLETLLARYTTSEVLVIDRRAIQEPRLDKREDNTAGERTGSPNIVHQAKESATKLFKGWVDYWKKGMSVFTKPPK
ncbi:hypothetical protein ACOME3_001623 [Neoechinorhynchus agilis]